MCTPAPLDSHEAAAKECWGCPLDAVAHTNYASIFTGAWEADYIYYTEADHLLYVKDIHQVIPFLDDRLYVVPYRFTEWYGPMNPWAGAGGVIKSIHRTIPFGGKKFEAICLCTGAWLNKTLVPG